MYIFGNFSAFFLWSPLGNYEKKSCLNELKFWEASRNHNGNPKSVVCEHPYLRILFPFILNLTYSWNENLMLGCHSRDCNAPLLFNDSKIKMCHFNQVHGTWDFWQQSENTFSNFVQLIEIRSLKQTSMLGIAPFQDFEGWRGWFVKVAYFNGCRFFWWKQKCE